MAAGAILLMVMLRRSDVQQVEAQIAVEEPLEATAQVSLATGPRPVVTS
jgi:hypothetical protein